MVIVYIARDYLPVTISVTLPTFSFTVDLVAFGVEQADDALTLLLRRIRPIQNLAKMGLQI